MFVYTDYENEQLKKIEEWKEQKPQTKEFKNPVVNKIQRFIPQRLIQKTLEISSRAAQYTTYKENIKWTAKVKNIRDLKTVSLEQCDEMARKAQTLALSAAATEGSVTGFFGIFGLAADIPASLLLAFRSIHQIAMCYGFEIPPDQHEVCVGVLSLVGATSVEEKTNALLFLRGAKNNFIVRKMVERLGMKFAERQLAAVVPYAGAAVSGYANTHFMKDVCFTAKMVFQEKWLLEKKERHIEKNM